MHQFSREVKMASLINGEHKSNTSSLWSVQINRLWIYSHCKAILFCMHKAHYLIFSDKSSLHQISLLLRLQPIMKLLRYSHTMQASQLPDARLIEQSHNNYINVLYLYNLLATKSSKLCVRFGNQMRKRRI